MTLQRFSFAIHLWKSFQVPISYILHLSDEVVKYEQFIGRLRDFGPSRNVKVDWGVELNRKGFKHPVYLANVSGS